MTSNMSKKLQMFIEETKRNFCDFYGTLPGFKCMKKKSRKSWRRFYRRVNTEIVPSGLRAVRNVRLHPLTAFCVILGSGTGYVLYRFEQNEKLKHEERVKRRSSERMFLTFASVEYKGQVYMTPLDFLDSVLEFNPRWRRIRRIALTDQQLEEILQRAPPQKENSSRFFSNLSGNGIISYSEYISLLSIIVQPQSTFQLTFKMLDTDQSGGIDKEEYLVMERIFSRHWKFSRGLQGLQGTPQLQSEERVDEETGLQRKQLVDTTLMIHFFGKDGTEVLEYNTFEQFLKNVQREILELEFNQFSHSLPFITELDFAQLLIQYTYLDSEYDYDNYINRLLARPERQTSERGISFEEFSSFILSLSNLEDFYFAVRYYAQVNPKLTKTDFHEAFRVMSEHNLSWDLIDMVFDIFDVDNSGYIIYQDFINVMNDRLHRGYRHVRKNKWETFKLCVKRTTQRNPLLFHKKKN